MLSSDIPDRFPIPFANNAGVSYIRPVPEASQIGIQDGAASLFDGFPPLTMTSIAGGGKWPFGQDFNGLLNQITAWNQWQAAGGPITYNNAFATAIGGYPKGAILASTLGIGIFWMSTVDNNTSNPDTGGANWVSFTPVSLYAIDSGSANAGVVTYATQFNPPALSYFTGVPLRFKKTAAVNTAAFTLNVNGFGATAVVNADGSALFPGQLPANSLNTVIYNGTTFQLATGVTPAQLQTQTGNFGFDSGTANALTVTLNPVPANLTALIGAPIRVKKAATNNTGNATINVNSLGAIAISHGNGTNVLPGELPANGVLTLVYDSVNFILQSVGSPRLLGPTLAGVIGTTVSPTIDEIGRTYVFSALGAGAGGVNLPSASVVGAGWWIRIRCPSTTLGDYGVITPFGAQTLDGFAARLFGMDSDIIVESNGVNFQTVSGTYVSYSTQLAIAASTVYTYTHNLSALNGAISLEARLYWLCTSADAGYSVGDLLIDKLTVVNGAAATNVVGISHDSGGNITRVMTSVTLVAPHKTTTIATNLDFTKWNLIIRVETH